MALVTVRINGAPHTVGCQDGQETHLAAMAAEVDRRLQALSAQPAATARPSASAGGAGVPLGATTGGVQGSHQGAVREPPGPAAESRLLVLAALMLADELHDSQAELEQTRWLLNQKPREVVRELIREVPREVPVPDSVFARKLASLADRAEEIAAGLERP